MRIMNFKMTFRSGIAAWESLICKWYIVPYIYFGYKITTRSSVKVYDDPRLLATCGLTGGKYFVAAIKKTN